MLNHVADLGILKFLCQLFLLSFVSVITGITNLCNYRYVLGLLQIVFGFVAKTSFPQSWLFQFYILTITLCFTNIIHRMDNYAFFKYIMKTTSLEVH
jgi:hypothetical protein